jgi:cobalamin biosynthesis protein CobD/CbiB
VTHRTQEPVKDQRRRVDDLGMHPITSSHAAASHCADAALRACANPHPTLIGGVLVILFILLVPVVLGTSALMSTRGAS